jgi:ABC-type uncharacterized transport system involved in gliding motility auxiliary subunit
MRLQAILRIVLVLALVILLGTLSQLYKTELDWTYGDRNSLSEASLELLERMPGPIVFTAFTSADAEMKRTILADLARYQRVRDNIEVEFVDPSHNPQRAREAGIRNFNEVEIRYDGNSEVVSALTEPAITGALQKLANPTEQVVYFLRGHGERQLQGGGELGMSSLVQALERSGLRVEALNLAETGSIPDDATAVALASPNSTPLPQEQRRLAEWIEDGGNFVWLADPDSARALDPLTEALSVSWQPGVAVFPDYQETSGHPGIFVAASYPPNPLTRRLDAVTVFPLVSGVEWDMDGPWDGMPLLVTSRSAWLETGAIEGDLVFDQEAGDIRGPITVGALLTREREQADGSRLQQRVAFVGDSDFLVNVYLEQGGNRQLALNLFQWAATRDKQLDIEVPKAPDSSLRLSGFALTAIAGGIVIGLPLLLVGFGITRWALRRRR